MLAVNTTMHGDPIPPMIDNDISRAQSAISAGSVVKMACKSPNSTVITSIVRQPTWFSEEYTYTYALKDRVLAQVGGVPGKSKSLLNLAVHDKTWIRYFDDSREQRKAGSATA